MVEVRLSWPRLRVRDRPHGGSTRKPIGRQRRLRRRCCSERVGREPDGAEFGQLRTTAPSRALRGPVLRVGIRVAPLGMSSSCWSSVLLVSVSEMLGSGVATNRTTPGQVSVIGSCRCSRIDAARAVSPAGEPTLHQSPPGTCHGRRSHSPAVAQSMETDPRTLRSCATSRHSCFADRVPDLTVLVPRPDRLMILSLEGSRNARSTSRTHRWCRVDHLNPSPYSGRPRISVSAGRGRRTQRRRCRRRAGRVP